MIAFWETDPVIREPVELMIDEVGRLVLPLGLLVEAGLDPGSQVMVFSDGDGRLVIRRASDAMRDLLERGEL